MRKALTPEQRLVVASNLFGNHSNPDLMYAKMSLMATLSSLGPMRGKGLTIKVESLVRTLGFSCIQTIHSQGFGAFADLKLYGTPQTLSDDGKLLRPYCPEFVTVACSCGVASMKALKDQLPDTEVLGVTVLTNMSDNDTSRIHDGGVHNSTFRMAKLAEEAGLDGLICSANEAPMLRKRFGDRFTLNVPNIRSVSSNIKSDDQNPIRSSDPAGAMTAGTDRIIVGRPISQSQDPLLVVHRILEEIASVL